MDLFIPLLILTGLAICSMPIVALIIAIRANQQTKRNQLALEELRLAIANLTHAEETGQPHLPEPQRLPGQGADEAELPEAIPAPTPGRQAKATPPPIPVAAPVPSEAPPAPAPQVHEDQEQAPAKTPVSIEQFMGVKLFAWLGGIAMFFGVIFFVKYAFERNLIPPGARVTMGFLTGAGLLLGGLWTHRREAYQTLAHTLCATGILVLYGVSFAAHAYYQFPAFGAPVTFVLMCLITVVAFLIAVRSNAQVVAVLGLLGGFMSPLLLPTIQDNVFGLFSYIALLDIGILATARHKPWKFLPALAALGTLIIEFDWFESFFHAGHYADGTQTLVPMGVLVGFCALFGLAAWCIHKKRPDDLIATRSALAVNTVAMLYGFFFLTQSGISSRPFLLYGFVLLLNAVPLAIATYEKRMAFAQFGIAIATFLHLALWTRHCLKPESLGSALIIYLVFGALHLAYPIIRQRLRPSGGDLPNQSLTQWLGPVMLLLMLLATMTQQSVPMFIWLAILTADLLIIFMAAKTARVGPTIGALILTLVIAAEWLRHIPPASNPLSPFLSMIILFAALFTGAGLWLSKSHPAKQEPASSASKLLPLLSATLPYGLLIMATEQLPMANPNQIFAAGLLLSLLLLGLTVWGRIPWLAPLGTLCMLALEFTWHAEGAVGATKWLSLNWHLLFYVLFAAFPLLYRRFNAEATGPWVGSCLSAIGHFLLIHKLADAHYAETMQNIMGLIPLAFSIPSLALLWHALETSKASDLARLRQFSWLGATSLLFITLIFPIQFERQWLTVSWALEGAALIWLFRKVPHDGLKWAGLALLAIVFCRLTVNPALFTSYPRSGTPIFNWYLYTYGLPIGTMIMAARLLPADHRKFRNIPVAGCLLAAAGILLFFLLNIEIADAFTQPGKRFVTFQFGDHFARDMTYSIAWGLFSLALLGIGIYKRIPAPRFAAIGLLGITLLKVFVHDLSQIESIYRIGALIGVAIIAFVTSFLYQRFYHQFEKN